MSYTRRFVVVADAIVIALLALAIVAELAVDLETRVFGIRITLKSTWPSLHGRLLSAPCDMRSSQNRHYATVCA